MLNKIIRADKLFERGQKLPRDRFSFWLCYVYGTMKSSMTDLQLDRIEKDLEEQEKYDTGQ